MNDYPEHEKMHAIVAQSQAIGEFLDNGPWTLCKWEPSPDVPQWIDSRTGTGLTPGGAPVSLTSDFTHENPVWFASGYYPDTRSIQRILAEYFGVDLDVIESEKRVMLAELREEVRR